MNILGFFKTIGRLIKRALQFAEQHGLTDDLVDAALRLVTQAQVQFDDNDQRKAWVLARLKTKHIPDSIANLALELAVQAWKQRVAP